MIPSLELRWGYIRRVGAKLLVEYDLTRLGLEPGYNISLYPGTGTADGIAGDHILLAPAYNSTPELIEEIVDATARAVEDFFAES